MTATPANTASGAAFYSGSSEASLPEHERHLRFRPDIEGMRAVAILLVVLYHAGWRRAQSGFLGVDVFFVLSGFLITGLLLDEVAAKGRVSLTKFWARRARRLLPAAAVVTLAVLVLNAVFLDPFEQKTFAETARAFAVYGSNILFAIRSTDYFGGAAVRDPLLHTWSLSVEEQFYVFFAPAMLIMAAWTRSRGPAVARWRFIVTTSLVTLVSLAGCLLFVRRYPVIAFYALPARAWEFGLGALTVIAARKADRLGRGALEVLAVMGLAAVVGSAVLLREGAGPPLGIRTLIPTIGAVALILAGAGAHRTLVARALSLSPVRLVGRLSYSWYLWHWPALVYLRALVPEPSLRLSGAVAVLALLPAGATYVLVESPIRFSVPLQRRGRQVVIAALLLAVITAGAATAAARYSDWVLGTPRYASILSARVKARTYSDGCQVGLLAVTSPECRYGPASNDTTVVLFGDSHAAQWFPAFDSVATMRGWSLVNLTKTGCPTVLIAVPNSKLGRRYTECDVWRQYAIDRVVALKPTLVVVTNERSYNVFVGSVELLTDSSSVARREWHDALVRTLTSLAPSGAKLVVLEDTPQPGRDVPRCLVKNIKATHRCTADVRRALNPESFAAERLAVAAVPRAAYVTLNPFICEGGKCPAVQNGIVRYQDESHLSVRFVTSLAPELSRTLSRTLAGPTPER
jgi:peptidoglycan/LPS O-acetylase OafA/YrhL